MLVHKVGRQVCFATKRELPVPEKKNIIIFVEYGQIETIFKTNSFNKSNSFLFEPIPFDCVSKSLIAEMQAADCRRE